MVCRIGLRQEPIATKWCCVSPIAVTSLRNISCNPLELLHSCHCVVSHWLTTQWVDPPTLVSDSTYLQMIFLVVM